MNSFVILHHYCYFNHQFYFIVSLLLNNKENIYVAVGSCVFPDLDTQQTCGRWPVQTTTGPRPNVDWLVLSDGRIGITNSLNQPFSENVRLTVQKLYPMSVTQPIPS